MTDFAADVLRTLRVFGPISNAEIGRRLGVAPYKTYRELYRLTKQGYAQHPKLQQWDISPKGRRWFRQQPNKPLTLFNTETP